jgi:hypothetical protein
MSWGRTCLRAGLVSGAWNYCLKSWEGAKISRGQTCPSTFGPDLSQGWTCLGAGLVLGPDLSQGWTCLGAGLVSGPDLSKNFGAGLVQKLQGLKCLAAGIVQKFRARSVSRPDLVRGWTSLGAARSPCNIWCRLFRTKHLLLLWVVSLSQIFWQILIS